MVLRQGPGLQSYTGRKKNKTCMQLKMCQFLAYSLLWPLCSPFQFNPHSHSHLYCTVYCVQHIQYMHSEQR